MKTLAVALTMAVVLLVGCDNLQHQPNSRALSPSNHFADGAAARLPVPGTVARGKLPSDDPFATGIRDRVVIATLPVPLTRALLERGRERFTINCAPCHGDDGYGQGIVVRRGFPAPPSYHDERLRAAPYGHFVEVIAHGYGVMYSYADRVEPADRWAIAAYIRALQRSQKAQLNDVPAEKREALNRP